jgi:hypothetical protein
MSPEEKAAYHPAPSNIRAFGAKGVPEHHVLANANVTRAQAAYEDAKLKAELPSSVDQEAYKRSTSKTWGDVEGHRKQVISERVADLKEKKQAMFAAITDHITQLEKTGDEHDYALAEHLRAKRQAMDSGSARDKDLSEITREKYKDVSEDKRQGAVEEGPRGGRYYIGSTGEKVYVKPNPGAEPVGRVSHMPFRAGLPAPVAQAEPVRAAFAPSPNSMAATYGQQVPFEIKEGK